MDDYAQYERECTKIREENARLLQEFAEWLRQSKLTTKTIQRHVDNIEFYVNEFLLYEEAIPAKDGVREIGAFLGYWFIKKAMWSSAAHIKSNAASLKKFYTFMCRQGHIDDDDLEELKSLIKEDMPEWIATMTRYDDPSITNMGDVWGLPSDTFE